MISHAHADTTLKGQWASIFYASESSLRNESNCLVIR